MGFKNIKVNLTFRIQQCWVKGGQKACLYNFKKHKAVITDSKTFDEIHGIVYQFNISVNVIY